MPNIPTSATKQAQAKTQERISAADYLKALANPKRGNRGAAGHWGSDGEWYHSIVEEILIGRLRQQQRAGLIRDLAREVRFDLHAAGGGYIGFAKIDAGFWDIKENRHRWQDAKSDRIRDTALSDWKFKHIEQEYAVIVERVRIKTPRKRRVAP